MVVMREGSGGSNEEEGSVSNGPLFDSIVEGSGGLDSGVSEQAVKQLLEIVKSRCTAVATHLNHLFLHKQ